MKAKGYTWLCDCLLRWTHLSQSQGLVLGGIWTYWEILCIRRADDMLHKTRFHIFYRSWGPHVYIYFKYFATQLWPLPHYKVCPNNAPYRKEHKSFSISFSRTLNGKKMGQALLSPAWSSCIPKSAVNYLIGRQQNAFRKQEHQADFKNGINLLWMRV